MYIVVQASLTLGWVQGEGLEESEMRQREGKWYVSVEEAQLLFRMGEEYLSENSLRGGTKVK